MLATILFFTLGALFFSAFFKVLGKLIKGILYLIGGTVMLPIIILGLILTIPFVIIGISISIIVELIPVALVGGAIYLVYKSLNGENKNWYN